MIRRLLKDSAVYGASTVLVQGLNLLLLPVYTRVLPPESYGILEILTVAALFVNIVVPLEINQGLARHYADTAGAGEKRRLASTTLWFTLAAYAFFLVLALPFSRPLAGLLLGTPAWESVFRIAVATMAANGLFLVFLNQLRWNLQPFPYAWASVLFAGTAAGAALLFVVGGDTGVIGIFYGQIIGAAVGSLYAWRAGRHLFGPLFSRGFCRNMLSFSLPLVPSSISVILATFLDRFVLQAFLGLAAVGVYAAGFRIASAVHLLVVGFYTALTPLIYKRYREKTTPAELARAFRLFLFGVLPLIMAVSLFAQEIVGVAVPPEYGNAWTVVPFLALASVTMRLYMFTPGLDIAKRTGIIAGINLAAAALNLCLNLALIPLWGIAGAAGATWISGLAAFGGYLYFSQRLYPVPHQWNRIVAAVALAVAVSVGGAEGISAALPCAEAALPAKTGVWLVASLLAGVLLRNAKGRGKSP